MRFGPLQAQQLTPPPGPPCAQAEASAARYAAGAALSVFDGVPYAVKDGVDVYAHKTGSGTTFLGDM